MTDESLEILYQTLDNKKEERGEFVPLPKKPERCELPVKVEKRLFLSPGSVYTHPFFRWVGGKRRLISELQEHVPVEFNTYYEPFLGGGALYFHLSANGLLARKRVVLGDVNVPLISAYKAVQNNVLLLSDHLASYEAYYLNSKGHEDEFYLQTRDEFNVLVKQGIYEFITAAQFLVLNRLAFNGVWKVTSNGKFCSPFGGGLKDQAIYNHANLEACHIALNGKPNGQKVELHPQSFELTLKDVQRGDFVYFDPPYVEIHKNSKSFPYDRKPFGLADQIRLRDMAVRFREMGVFVLLTNADNDVTRALYEESGFKIKSFKKGTALSGKGTTEKKELVIW